MKCQVCGAESGKYPLCRHCNDLKNQGLVFKCPKCHTWHYKGAPCPTDSAAAPQSEEAPAAPAAAPEAAPAPAEGTPAEQPPVISDDGKPFLYEAKSALMSAAEQDYYLALSACLPQGFHLYPQVNLAAFLQRTDHAHFQNELFRNVDFLITDQAQAPRLAVEINDRSHLDQKRKERDEKVRCILEEAGIPLLTLWLSKEINRDYLEGEVRALLNTPVRRIHHFGPSKKPEKKKGCYIATCVYGSYDCAPVWTLRRFRDEALARSWYGRAFIRLYYAVSPSLVRCFGGMAPMRKLWKQLLDPLVVRLRRKGYSDTPYSDF